MLLMQVIFIPLSVCLETNLYIIIMTKQYTEFFTKTDIELIAEMGRKNYSKNNSIDVEKKQEIINGPWRKTFYWHDLVLNQLNNYDGEAKAMWHIRGAKFQSYTWTRIFKKKDKDKGIFFTVGIAGDTKSLEFKLDYKHNGVNSIKGVKRDICIDKIKKSAASSILVNIDLLPEYNWDRLVCETIDFIKKYEALYDDVIEKVWNANEKKITEISYNEEGWQRPSGIYGKNRIHHEYGYSNDEWIFDIDKVINGAHYAYLEPISKAYTLHENTPLDVFLFAVNYNTKVRYWIGEISNVEVISEEESKYIFNYYKDKNWLKSMDNEIKATGANIEHLVKKEPLDCFNVKFNKSSVTIYDNPKEIESSNPIYKVKNYSLLDYDVKYNLIDSFNDVFDPFKNLSSLPPDENIGAQTIKYSKPPRVVEMKFLHKDISSGLHRYFANIYGKENVVTDVPAGYGGNEVDMIVRRNDKEVAGLVYYEIKTYLSARLSIREALGQIIEYAMWPDTDRSVKLVIVTQPCPSEEEYIKKYLPHLRKKFNIELYYQSFDINTQILSKEI